MYGWVRACVRVPVQCAQPHITRGRRKRAPRCRPRRYGCEHTHTRTRTQTHTHTPTHTQWCAYYLVVSDEVVCREGVHDVIGGDGGCAGDVLYGDGAADVVSEHLKDGVRPVGAVAQETEVGQGLLG